MEKKHSHTCISNSLAMHKDSKTISKSSINNKPKIRIIHIFAPQIIKTDVENFRELVQRKTGKPAAAIAGSGSGEDQEYSIRRINSNNNNSLMSGLLDDDDNKSKSKNKKMEQLMRNKFTVKEERICISDEISSGGYLGGFSDLEEGFISEFGGFSSSMLPLD